jgi:outer membrane autotransporter protein
VNTGSITGNAALTGTSSGIYATVSGTASITNSGTITSSAKYFTTGIGSHAGSATINNSGSVAAVSGVAVAAGFYINAVAGNTSVTNSGRVTGTSTFSGPGPGNFGAFGTGISTYASGTATIVNNGYAGGFSSGNGVVGTGISADSGVGNSILVTNNGTAIGTTEGIALENSGTVNNYGLASGGLYSIYVLTGSTVNLDGASPVSGLLKGGTNDTSTSQLNFDIAIDGNRLAADETALNAAIAQYNTALTNAVHGAGHDVDSTVVVLNGIDYQWEDFAGVADNLVQGRLYVNTPGYGSLGSVLDNLPNNAASNTILNALGNVSDADVAAALSELSPQQLQVFRNVAFDNNTFNVAKINNHLANRRDGATGFDSSQLTVRDPSLDGTLDQVRSHLLAYNNPASSLGPVSDSAQAMFGAVDTKDAKETPTVALATAPSDRWSTFIAGDVLLANLSNSATQQNSNYTTGSVTAGADYQPDDHFTVGALLGYAHTDANLDSRGSSATVDSYTAGLYASYVNKGWYANFLGAYSRNAYTSDRMVDIAGLGGDNHGATSGNQGSANLTGGYEFQKGAFKFGPIASVQYVHLAIDSTQEQGPTALSIGDQSQDSLRSQLGLEGRFVADVNTPLGPMTLTPHLSASWQHEYMDSSGGITSQFTGTGGGSFVTQTQSPDRDAAFIDVGLDANIGQNVTVFVDYETQVGQKNYFAQSAEGGVKIGF